MASRSEAPSSDENKVLEDAFIVDTDVHIAEPPGELKRYTEEPWDTVVANFEENYRMRDTRGYMPGMELGSPLWSSAESRPSLTSGEQTARELSELHVDVGILFPENFLKVPIIPDVEYAVALSKAYNNYMIDRFLDESEDLYGALLAPPHDVDAAVEEIDRLAGESQITSVFLSVCGVNHTYGHPQYRPIFEAASDYGLSIAFHSAGIDYPEFPFNTHKLPHMVRHTLNHELSLMVNAMDIVVRGVPERFPDLDFGFLEGGLSWVPMAAHRLDREYMQHRDEVPILTKRPSEYISEFYIGTHPLEITRDSEDIVRLIELIDCEDQLMFATDWPHHDFDHPTEIQKLPVDRDQKAKIWGENAAEFFDLN
jgi:predicted TIM-barrel fold metal-dependent hydrolase